MKKFLKGAIVTLSFVAGLSVVTIPFVHAEKNENVAYSDSSMTKVIPHVTENYSVNENGQTYGILSNSVYPEDNPRLVKAIGDNGKEGYVYYSDLIAGPETPEEAKAYRLELESGNYVPKSINVYESDGKTVIDTFTETISDHYAHLYE